MRFWEIDFARGLAVFFMVIFNWTFALSYFGIVKFESYFFWIILPRIIAGTFIFISGVTLYISYTNFSNALRRIGVLLLFAFAITSITLYFVPSSPVLFGILHLIAVGSLISLLFVKKPKLAGLFGAIIIIAGLILTEMKITFNYFFFLVPSQFKSLDYFPILPWVGVMLLGIYAASFWYKKDKRNFKIKQLNWTQPIELIGKHSLGIYIVHIPFLILCLIALGNHVII